MPNYVLDKSYTVETAGGIPAHRIVVAGTAPGSCKLPPAEGVSGGVPLGVTTHAQSQVGRSVAVRKLGIALVEAGGAVAAGLPVDTDADGRIRAAAPDIGSLTWAIGYTESSAAAAGDLVEVFLSIHRFVEPFVP